MNVRYRVTLSHEEREQLREMVRGGKGRVRRLKRAQILLAAEAGATDETIATNVGVGTSTVYRTKRRFVEEGLEEALNEEPRPGAERKLSAREEALLVATACAKPPAGSSAMDARAPGGRDGPADVPRVDLDGDDSEAAGREGAEALAEEDVVHPEGRCGVRGPDGGRSGTLRRGPGQAIPGGVLRRDPSAAHRGGARARGPSPGSEPATTTSTSATEPPMSS